MPVANRGNNYFRMLKKQPFSSTKSWPQAFPPVSRSLCRRWTIGKKIGRRIHNAACHRSCCRWISGRQQLELNENHRFIAGKIMPFYKNKFLAM